jgi:RimJ/RimL family protein N-acetyltransferase
VERKATADVIGYCGLTIHGNGSPDEPGLAYELLRAAHGCGYATEAGRAVVTWASDTGYHRLWAAVWDWNVPSRRNAAYLPCPSTNSSPMHRNGLVRSREFR